MFSIGDGLNPDSLTRGRVKRGRALYVTPGLNALELPTVYNGLENEGEMSIRLKPFSTAVKDATHPAIFTPLSRPTDFDQAPAVGTAE